MQMLTFLKNTRRQLHQYPELGFNEHKTTSLIISHIQKLGLTYFTPLKTGVIAMIEGTSDQTIAFRADIDALPIQEMNDVSYQSTVKNVMHACGHDGHTTNLIALMYQLSEYKAAHGLHYNVMFIFQPSEESNAGAKQLIDAFDFDAYHIVAIYGMHLMPDANSNEILYKDEAITASATEYRFFIEGKSAHVANKQTGHAASEALMHIINQVATIQQFHLPGLNQNIIHIGQFNAGEAINTVPSNAYLEGTIRTYDAMDLMVVKTQMQNIAKAVTLVTNCVVNVTFAEGYPPTFNAPTLKTRIDLACERAKLKANILKQPYLFGEDFSFYNKIAPSYFVFVGCKNEALGFTSGLHTNTFNFDETVLLNSLNLFMEIIRGYEHEC